MQTKFLVAIAALAAGVVADFAAPAGGLVARGEPSVPGLADRETYFSGGTPKDEDEHSGHGKPSSSAKPSAPASSAKPSVPASSMKPVVPSSSAKPSLSACAPPVTVTVTVCPTATPKPSVPATKPVTSAKPSSPASSGFPPKPTNGTSIPPKATPPAFTGAAGRNEAGIMMIGGVVALAAYLL